jgi:hypothetical protein
LQLRAQQIGLGLAVALDIDAAFCPKVPVL